MNMEEDIRWVQRFQNFSRAFLLLRSVLEEKAVADFSELEQEGIIQRFEYTFELAWKMLKDYLEYSGIPLKEITPRNVIREAAASGIFAAAEIEGEVFLNMLLARNMLSHTYDFEKFKMVLQEITLHFLGALEKLYLFFLEKKISND